MACVINDKWQILWRRRVPELVRFWWRLKHGFYFVFHQRCMEKFVNTAVFHEFTHTLHVTKHILRLFPKCGPSRSPIIVTESVRVNEGEGSGSANRCRPMFGVFGCTRDRCTFTKMHIMLHRLEILAIGTQAFFFIVRFFVLFLWQDKMNQKKKRGYPPFSKWMKMKKYQIAEDKWTSFRLQSKAVYPKPLFCVQRKDWRYTIAADIYIFLSPAILRER